MALRKDNTTPNTSMFEGEDGTNPDTATATATATETKPADAVKEVVQQARASSAVVVASNNALANALRKTTVLDESQGVIGVEALETMGIGAFPRVTVDQAGFSKNKTEFLGAWVAVEMLSWSFVTLITTGEKDDKDADKLIRSSYDGVNIPGESTTVDQYIDFLKSDEGGGYDKACSKKYIEIYAMLNETAKGGVIAEPQMVQLSVSPQSVKQFQRFLLESRMAAFKNKAVTSAFPIAAQRVVSGANTYGVMQFGTKTAA